MLAGLALLVILVEVLKRGTDLLGRPVGGLEVARIVFYAVSLSLVLVINLVQGFMLKGTRAEDMGELCAKLTTVSIITSALAEIPIILGFVLFVIAGYHTDFYILGFVSLYLMVRHFPYFRQWEKFARSRMGAKWPSGPVSG